jgi:hypothetical protein
LTDLVYASSMSTNSKPRSKPVTKLRSVSTSERRLRRTEDVMDALHFQLDACRQDAELTAMVIADDYGMCLASAGAVGTCSEIAARLPMLGRKAGDFEGVLLGSLGKQGGVPVAMKRIKIDGTDLFACAVGGNASHHAAQLSRAELGLRRILGTVFPN